MYFCYFIIISPWKRVGLLIYLNKFECPSPKDALCQVWLKLASWFWRRFVNFVNVFSLFLGYLPLEIGWGHSFEQTWIPLTQGCIVPSLVEIGPEVLEKMIFKCCQCIFAIPLEKGGALHLNKLESSSPKNVLYQVWLKMAKCFCKRRFLNFAIS